mmetsp:Transcript_3341/g.7809  ORF Transcript_3341/g.7809 Transcript_3341/m.7809 type:complete len:312 (+) Transcript_3341:238-1173(+)
MSRCAHSVPSFSTNCFRNSAAVMAPPPRDPVFFMSAMSLFMLAQYDSVMGMRQNCSPAAAAAAISDSAILSLGENSPATSGPSATITAPVSVATSTMDVQPTVCSAYTSASARVRRPSASVLLTSMVLPLDAVRMSPGRMPRLPIMFSQLAMMKCTSTPGGWVSAMVRAAPSTAPAPPMSNFIISIMDPAPALMLYPPESKVKPLPTRAIFLTSAPAAGDVYVRWMNLGGSSDASDTPRNDPMPSFSHSTLSSTLRLMHPGNLAAIMAATSARAVGVTTLGGAATSSLVSTMPAAAARAAATDTAWSSSAA